MNYAKANNLIISYDPNLRLSLWKSADEARDRIFAGLKYCDILKVSQEELEFITTEKDLEKGTKLLHEMGISLIIVTLGSEGAFYRYNLMSGKLCTYNVEVSDTTGAGDAFLGGVLYKLRQYDLNGIKNFSLSKKIIEDAIDFGNAAGALATTRKGAIPSIPNLDEVNYCIKNIQKQNI